MKEDDHHDLQPVWTSDGRFQALKQATTVPLLLTTEQLLVRVGILSTAWQFCGFQQTQNLIFAELTPHVWVEHCDYILGDHFSDLISQGGRRS